MNLYSITTDTNTHYTKGGEYSFEGSNYAGEFHYKDGKPYAGPFGSVSNRPLTQYYSSSVNYTYDKLFNFNKIESTLKQPAKAIITPTDKDYEVGSYQRYFMQNLIDKNKIPVEITRAQYESLGKPGGLDNQINAAFTFVWFLTGPLTSYKDSNGYVVDGLTQKNEKTIQTTSQLYSNIIYTVKNYVEFARPTFV
jgi:hypothetical protein